MIDSNIFRWIFVFRRWKNRPKQTIQTIQYLSLTTGFLRWFFGAINSTLVSKGKKLNLQVPIFFLKIMKKYVTIYIVTKEY